MAPSMTQTASCTTGLAVALISTSVLCNLSRALTLQLKYVFHFGPATTDLRELSFLPWPCSFPREWIKGNGYPTGIDRNTELSSRDKEHVKRLYGPPRISPGEKSVPPPIPQPPEKSEYMYIVFL